MDTLAQLGGLGCFRGGSWSSCPSTCLEGRWENRCCSKAQAELFQAMGLLVEGKHGLSATPAGSFFFPTLLVLLMLSGPFLAFSSSGAGSRNCPYVLQAGAQPLPGHSSASLAATWTNSGHKPPLDFCGFFSLLTTPS